MLISPPMRSVGQEKERENRKENRYTTRRATNKPADPAARSPPPSLSHRPFLPTKRFRRHHPAAVPTRLPHLPLLRSWDPLVLLETDLPRQRLRGSNIQLPAELALEGRLLGQHVQIPERERRRHLDVIAIRGTRRWAGDAVLVERVEWRGRWRVELRVGRPVAWDTSERAHLDGLGNLKVAEERRILPAADNATFLLEGVARIRITTVADADELDFGDDVAVASTVFAHEAVQVSEAFEVLDLTVGLFGAHVAIPTIVGFDKSDGTSAAGGRKFVAAQKE